MPFQRKRASLVLPGDIRVELMNLSRSRTEAVQKVERASALLAYADGEAIHAIARRLGISRPTVERTVDKALQMGPRAALEDLAGRGRKPAITDEARAWLVNLACRKPKELGYSYELWTTKLLAEHARKHVVAAGHPCLAQLARGTVSKILNAHDIRPHKIHYYMERRDPDFEAKMVQVLCVYKEVALLLEKGGDVSSSVAILSYDEKPGIQAIGNTAPDLPPVPGEHSAVGRDHEYVRHGTVSLLAGIDLLTGHVWGQVRERHRSKEFVEFLQLIDESYPETATIRIILDNHSAHVSKETRQYLSTVPNRFEFIFTPKHGSWLNLIENFFAKMAKTVLRGIRVESREELILRIELYLEEINRSPVIHRWTYGLDSISVA